MKKRQVLATYGRHRQRVVSVDLWSNDHVFSSSSDSFISNDASSHVTRSQTKENADMSWLNEDKSSTKSYPTRQKIKPLYVVSEDSALFEEETSSKQKTKRGKRQVLRDKSNVSTDQPESKSSQGEAATNNRKTKAANVGKGAKKKSKAATSKKKENVIERKVEKVEEKKVAELRVGKPSSDFSDFENFSLIISDSPPIETLDVKYINTEAESLQTRRTERRNPTKDDTSVTRIKATRNTNRLSKMVASTPNDLLNNVTKRCRNNLKKIESSAPNTPLLADNSDCFRTSTPHLNSATPLLVNNRRRKVTKNGHLIPRRKISTPKVESDLREQMMVMDTSLIHRCDKNKSLNLSNVSSIDGSPQTNSFNEMPEVKLNMKVKAGETPKLRLDSAAPRTFMTFSKDRTPLTGDSAIATRLGHFTRTRNKSRLTERQQPTECSLLLDKLSITDHDDHPHKNYKNVETKKSKSNNEEVTNNEVENLDERNRGKFPECMPSLSSRVSQSSLLLLDRYPNTGSFSLTNSGQVHYNNNSSKAGVYINHSNSKTGDYPASKSNAKSSKSGEGIHNIQTNKTDDLCNEDSDKPQSNQANKSSSSSSENQAGTDYEDLDSTYHSATTLPMINKTDRSTDEQFLSCSSLLPPNPLSDNKGFPQQTNNATYTLKAVENTTTLDPSMDLFDSVSSSVHGNLPSNTAGCGSHVTRGFVDTFPKQQNHTEYELNNRMQTSKIMLQALNPEPSKDFSTHEVSEEEEEVVEEEQEVSDSESETDDLTDISEVEEEEESVGEVLYSVVSVADDTAQVTSDDSRQGSSDDMDDDRESSDDAQSSEGDDGGVGESEEDESDHSNQQSENDDQSDHSIQSDDENNSSEELQSKLRKSGVKNNTSPNHMDKITHNLRSLQMSSSTEATESQHSIVSNNCDTANKSNISNSKTVRDIDSYQSDQRNSSDDLTCKTVSVVLECLACKSNRLNKEHCHCNRKYNSSTAADNRHRIGQIKAGTVENVVKSCPKSGDGRFMAGHESVCKTPSRFNKSIADELRESCHSFKALTPVKDRRTSVVLSPKQKVLVTCEQDAPKTFTQAIPLSMMRKCVKIGEGVYGEVFKTERNKQSVALKVIPIEGDFEVNDERQKTFAEMLPEIVISKELSSLRDGEENMTANYVQVKSVCVVKGEYPTTLLKQWDLYHRTKGSENDRPDMFSPDQLFIMFEFEECGKDLEAFQFESISEAKSVLLQVTCSLAVAEVALQFEHRDLHWGNVLVKRTEEETLQFSLGGEEFEVETCGVKVSVIDFTLSRLSKDGCAVFCDLSEDPTLFEGHSDYQFDVYRLMKEENSNSWQDYHPYTNVLWIHYVAEKLIKNKHYPHAASRQHKSIARQFRNFLREALDYRSALHLFRDCPFFNE